MTDFPPPAIPGPREHQAICDVLDWTAGRQLNRIIVSADCDDGLYLYCELCSTTPSLRKKRSASYSDEFPMEDLLMEAMVHLATCTGGAS